MSALIANNKEFIHEYFNTLCRSPKTEQVIDRYVADPSLKQHILQAEAAFPGYQLVIEQMTVEDDIVAVAPRTRALSPEYRRRVEQYPSAVCSFTASSRAASSSIGCSSTPCPSWANSPPSKHRQPRRQNLTFPALNSFLRNQGGTMIPSNPHRFSKRYPLKQPLASWTMIALSLVLCLGLGCNSSSSRLAGTWEGGGGDGYASSGVTLTLNADGTYQKTLGAKVSNFGGGSNSYGGTHSGTWTAEGTTVHLSGDGNWPASTHDLSTFHKVN